MRYSTAQVTAVHSGFLRAVPIHWTYIYHVEIQGICVCLHATHDRLSSHAEGKRNETKQTVVYGVYIPLQLVCFPPCYHQYTLC